MARATHQHPGMLQCALWLYCANSPEAAAKPEILHEAGGAHYWQLCSRGWLCRAGFRAEAAGSVPCSWEAAPCSSTSIALLYPRAAASAAHTEPAPEGQSNLEINRSGPRFHPPTHRISQQAGQNDPQETKRSWSSKLIHTHPVLPAQSRASLMQPGSASTLSAHTRCPALPS